MKIISHLSLRYFLISLVLLALEICIARYISDGWIRGFLGDAIVVVLIYSFLRIFVIENPRSIAKLSFLIACMIEILQAFDVGERLGMTGVWLIIFGSTFDPMDIVAYGLGFFMCLILEFKKN